MTTVRFWRGGTLRTLLCPTYSIVARVKHTVYLTQHNSILICVVQMTHSSVSCYFRELGAILKACRPDARARQRTLERTPALPAIRSCSARCAANPASPTAQDHIALVLGRGLDRRDQRPRNLVSLKCALIDVRPLVGATSRARRPGCRARSPGIGGVLSISRLTI